MINKTTIFFIDKKDGLEISYKELISKLNSDVAFESCLIRPSMETFLINFIKGIILHQKITILDLNFSDAEIEKLIGRDAFCSNVSRKLDIGSSKEFVSAITSSKSEIELFTSGTTGKPKKVVHKISKLLGRIRVNENRSQNIWALAFNITHMAGIQVFLQALCNLNPIINVFGSKRKQIFELIRNYSITHISASPSFYRMLSPFNETMDSVTKVTLGGEKSTPELFVKLKHIFPLARFKNIYATTETGTVLISENNIFKIPKKIEDKIRIEDDEILLHKTLVINPDKLMNSDWYYTGDLVEIIQSIPLVFKFKGRKENIINVGGYNVNPDEIIDELLNHELIKEAKVIGKKNSLIGNLLLANVVLFSGVSMTEKQIIDYLRTKLQPHKLPRMIRIVDEIDLNRNGKK